MNKIHLLLLAAIFVLSLIYNLPQANAQAPDAIKYQAVIRDTNGVLLANQQVTVRASIYKNIGPAQQLVFVEDHDITSNQFGLVSFVIGQGDFVQSTLSSINWASGDYELGIEMDTGGGSFLPLTQAPLLSVPYALYGKDEDADPTNEFQDLSLSGHQLSITEGNMVTLPNDADNLGNHIVTQNISLDTNWISHSGLNEGIRVDSFGQTTIKLTNQGGEDASLRITSAVASIIALERTNEFGYGAGEWQIEVDNDWFALRDKLNGYSRPFTVQTGAPTSSIFIAGNGNVGIGDGNPAEKLEVDGIVKSKSGGFMFPDGTQQTTAAISDNLGNHMATSNIQLNNNWLSNDGDNEGLTMDSTGHTTIAVDNGLHTTPILKLLSGDGPNVRLHQDGSMGYGAYEWTVGGNESNFYIRDETGGSNLSFYIRSGAPAHSLNISSSGNVGIGDGNPDEKLEVDGIVKSKSGGFMFPDGTVQSSASHNATQNLQLNNNWLSNDGDNEGIAINNDGGVTIGNGANAHDVHVISGAGAEVNLINGVGGPHWQMVSGFSGGFEIGYVTDTLTDGDAPFFISSTGQVGIGTTTPDEELHIESPDSLGTVLVTPAQGAAGYSRLFLAGNGSASQGAVWEYDGFDKQLNLFGMTSSTLHGPHMSIEAETGNMGLGFLSTSANLNVRGNSNNISVLRIEGINGEDLLEVDIDSTIDMIGTLELQGSMGINRVSSSATLNIMGDLTHGSIFRVEGDDGEDLFEVDRDSTIDMVGTVEIDEGRLGVNNIYTNCALTVKKHSGSDYLFLAQTTGENTVMSITPINNVRMENDLIVGNASKIPASDLHVYQEDDNNSTDGITLEYDNHQWNIQTMTSQGSSPRLYFSLDGSQEAYIGSNGNYNQASDRRYKKDIQYLESVLPNFVELAPATYRFKNESDSVQKSFGFIAQEVLELFPEMVKVDNDGFMSLAYSDFAVLAVQAIKEQQVLIGGLTSQNESLKATFEMQSSMVQKIQAEMQELKSLLKAQSSITSQQ